MKLFGLIGFPLEHSLSPAWFNGIFHGENLPGFEYRLFPLHQITRLPALLEDMPELCGLNVTIPYKTAIIPYLSETDPVAGQTGAVNTIAITREKGKIITRGYNTDVTGFRESLTTQLKPHHDHALVMGSGGASRAVIHVLSQLGIPFKIVTRTPVEENQLAYSKLLTMNEIPPLVIHTTPLGMSPLTNTAPLLPFHRLTQNHFIFDLVYNPAETLLLKQAREQGAQTCNGLEMLHLQADAAWKIWKSHF
jgi:shikimate dehydrogenase